MYKYLFGYKNGAQDYGCELYDKDCLIKMALNIRTSK